MRPTVSIVIPCYNEVGTLDELYTRLREEGEKLGLLAEIIFVDDGSTDGSQGCLRALAEKDPLCRVILFRLNCGKAMALQTGFSLAEGDYILTLDADLQDDPAEIPRFLDALQQADVVSGWKKQRHDPARKLLATRIFNAVVRRATGVKLHDMNCGWKGYRQQVLREIAIYGELHRYIPALAAARGFRIAELAVTHHPRRSGKSKYGLERFIRGFFDMITVLSLTKYRFRPLHLFGGMGLCIAFLGLTLGAGLNIYLAISRMHSPLWYVIDWLAAFIIVLFGLVTMLFGILAENQLAFTFPHLPPPPIAEALNCASHSEPESVAAAGR